MTFKFLADEDFDNRIVSGLLRRAPDVDVVRVQDVGLRTFDDVVVLEWAAAEGRILLTHDFSTMQAPAYQRVADEAPMPGVFELHQRLALSDAIEALLLIVGASEPAEWQGAVYYLPLR